MKRLISNLKCAVAATVLAFAAPASLVAQEADRLAPLFERLQNVDPADAQAIEHKIWLEWSKSGSAAMDLLLERGRKAMEAEDYTRAIEHFTALTDHAPEFAEGWNARATAFFKAERLGLALEDIRMALRLEPRHFGAMSGFAVILNELGYEQEALEAYREVQKIHPHRANLASNIEQLEAQVAGKSL